ncbi:protoporphyrinogen oxidase [Natrialba swarupiae]|uniref:Protoporphyrinogen oxidase n=1 Tax=Natrialba swarupiae TaxID=2448032 RepID=A0A5D5AJ54_9EURY|nr:protoporphyrinogen oxidase [Natrialba swarupiae]TYT61055.1 protoporphyrinogen oxidase [Natrialba swarupiae]
MTVGVVGAGISGLTVVHELENRGADVLAYEARDEPGGVMRSRHVDGRVVELGPQRLRLTPGIDSLIDDLGLRDQLRFGDDDQPLYLYYDGELRVVPLSVREALTTNLLSLRGKLRILKEPFTDPARPGETVDEFLVRKFGPQAARRFFGPLYSGLYGTETQEMPMQYSLGRVLEKRGIDGSILLWIVRKLLSGSETPPVCTFDDGLGELPRRLYEAHADSIALETPVTQIRNCEHEEGFELVTENDAAVVDDVVLTTPAGTSADLLESVDSGLAATLDRFNYNPIAIVFLESAFDREGIGTLVPSTEPSQISGLTWNASFLDRDRVFTCYIDPGRYPDLIDASDDELAAVATTEFERITGADATPLDVHVWTPGMPAYDRSWTAMDDLELPDGIHLCANYVGRAGIPGRIRNGTRLADTLAGGK